MELHIIKVSWFSILFDDSAVLFFINFIEIYYILTALWFRWAFVSSSKSSSLMPREYMFLVPNNWIMIKPSNLSICAVIVCVSYLLVDFSVWLLCYMVKMKLVIFYVVPSSHIFTSLLETGLYAVEGGS